MGVLWPRSASVSITTYVATAVVLILWLLAAVAVAIYLSLHRRKRAHGTQRTYSHASTIPRFPSSDPTLLLSYPQRAQQAPSYPTIGPSSLSASMRHTDSPHPRTPPNADPVPPGAPTRIQHSGPIATVSPTRYPIPDTPPTNKATQRALLTNKSAQAANLARLQAMALASDTTDMSAETVELGKEVVNAGYLNMLARMGVPLKDHALLGSDDSTDAGGGVGAALNYAFHPRGLGPSGGRFDWERNQGSFSGRGESRRAVSLRQEHRDEEVEGVKALQVRKMSSM